MFEKEDEDDDEVVTGPIDVEELDVTEPVGELVVSSVHVVDDEVPLTGPVGDPEGEE